MRVWRVALNFVFLGLLNGGWAGTLLAQGANGSAPSGDSSDTSEASRREAEAAIRDLQQVANELNDAVRLLESHVDAAIIKYDSGYKAEGVQVLAADADLGGNRNSGVRRDSLRKLVAARMRASRTDAKVSPVLADMDHVEQLIGLARMRLGAADPLIKRYLVVSVDDLKQGKGFEYRTTHDQLLKVRALAEQAARKAALALPVDLPEGDTPDDSKDKAFTLLVGGQPVSPSGRVDGASRSPGGVKPAAPLPPLYFGWERNKRVTLVREAGYRMALTDPGFRDAKGRSLFYQEEWVERGGSIVRRRWRVAADPDTGRQILIKRYVPLEYKGDFDEAYRNSDRDYLWKIEPPESSEEPARDAVEPAIASVTAVRQQLQESLEGFDAEVRSGLAGNDQLAQSSDVPAPDGLLSEDLRVKLFAIRGHLAGAPMIVAAEERVSSLADALSQAISALEPLAAWANRATPNAPDAGPPLKLSVAEWDALQARADTEIDLAMATQAQMKASLPPSLLVTLGKFPALQKDVIVHITRQGSASAAGSTRLRCLQEVWLVISPERNVRRVQRIVSEILVDADTGRQSVLRAGTRYYDAGPDEILERVFDRYSGQDVFAAGVAP